MRTRALVACMLLLLQVGKPAHAHRLDEYLQATTISLEKDRVQVQIHLTPGVAVFPKVLATIDTNHDGSLSEGEQHAYADRVLRDLSLTVNGNPLPLHLVSWKFAKIAEMTEGLGEIQLDIDAPLPHTNPNRHLVFENHHQSRIAVYLVNCLVPADPNIQVTAQRRNYQQSHYELDYVQVSTPATSRPTTWWPLARVGLLIGAPIAWLGWRVGRRSK